MGGNFIVEFGARVEGGELQERREIESWRLGDPVTGNKTEVVASGRGESGESQEEQGEGKTKNLLLSSFSAHGETSGKRGGKATRLSRCFKTVLTNSRY